MKLMFSIKQFSLFIIILLLASMLMPAASFAYESARIYYNPQTGKLSGTVYVNDPSKVKVTVTDSAYGTFELPYQSTSEVTTYDDKNNVIKSGFFSKDGILEPSKITLTACGSPLDLIKHTYSANTIVFESDDEYAAGIYRTAGKQHFTDYPAGTFLPSGAKLVDFSPNVSGTDTLLLQLPRDNSGHTSVINSVYASDITLTDTTVNQAVYIHSLTSIGDIFSHNMTLETRDGFIQGHQYKLALSNTSDGTEISQPPTGNYTFQTNLRLAEKKNNVYLYKNAVYFRGLSFSTQTADGTSGSDDGGSRFGMMQSCGSSNSSNSGGSGPASPSDDGVKDNGKGVELGKGAATVTKVTDADGKITTKVVLDGEKLGKALGLLKNKDKGAQTVTIEVDGSEPVVRVELPASALVTSAKESPDAIVSIKSGSAVYDLPLKLLDLDGLAKRLGADLKDVKIQVSIEKLTGSLADQISQKVNESGLKMLVQAVDFNVTAEANGKKETINNFGSTYVTRTLTVGRIIDSRTATAVLYDPETGEIRFVPAEFVIENGQTQVKMKRNGNSIYSVVESSKSFNDIGSHWAKADIELLASKLVVNGRTNSDFAPEDSITRAEFASLIVRSLGLSPEKSAAAAFTDVQASEWHAGSVGAAVKAGLVSGFENGTFRPNDNITREQAAVMIARALAFAGKADAAAAASLNAELSIFKDAEAISVWAQAAVASAVQTGIVNGAGNDAFGPRENATRAQAAVMLKRLLSAAKFIN